jgi:hypothetical protein
MPIFFRCLKILTVLSIFYSVFPKPVYAYIDLGSGSYFFQLILGALLGIGFAIKIYWKKIKSSLANLFLKHRKKQK